jgi:serine protease AprX
VQAETLISAREHVTKVGGSVTQEFESINSVSAVLTNAQVAQLRSNERLKLFKDRALTTSSIVYTDGTSVKAKDFESNYVKLVGADTLQLAGITGKDVTIAVLDTGFWATGNDGIKKHILETLDVVNGASAAVAKDPYGHGTHVTSIAAGVFGIAPDANLVLVRAFDGAGAGNYTDVIAGLNWIIANRAKYNIRVLNLSFGAPPQSNYWDDPLNRAVMAAWKAGIVVVASAGNEGPDAMTIGVPGNVPYVITAGAITDNQTPYDPSDDRLASFSSAGPTLEGFVKPDVLAPGGHMVGSMGPDSYLTNIDPKSMKKKDSLFTMSGTSQAAAVTSGVAALMIQANPTLTPDTVKCRLLASARAAATVAGQMAYSIFQQGAGFINAPSAVYSSAVGCANQRLNITADLAGTQHFGGPANQDAFGNYYVMNLDGSTWGASLFGDGYTWSRGFSWTQGYTWSKAYSWSSGYTWSRGYTWSKGYTWTRGYTWSKGYTWSRTLPWWDLAGTVILSTRPVSIVSWIPNE